MGGGGRDGRPHRGRDGDGDEEVSSVRISPATSSLTIGPILEDVVAALSQRPEIMLVNAAGRDHVRGAGLAIQLGAAIDVPTVGVTERPDVGDAPEPGTHRGDWTPVRIDNRLVGFRVRTLSKANPVMAHAAWLTTPETARDIGPDGDRTPAHAGAAAASAERSPAGSGASTNAALAVACRTASMAEGWPRSGRSVGHETS